MRFVKSALDWNNRCKNVEESNRKRYNRTGSTEHQMNDGKATAQLSFLTTDVKKKKRHAAQDFIVVNSRLIGIKKVTNLHIICWEDTNIAVLLSFIPVLVHLA
jgi:hypothetical protein